MSRRDMPVIGVDIGDKFDYVAGTLAEPAMRRDWGRLQPERGQSLSMNTKFYCLGLFEIQWPLT